MLSWGDVISRKKEKGHRQCRIGGRCKRYLNVCALLTRSRYCLQDRCGRDHPGHGSKENQTLHEAAVLLACGPVQNHPRNVVASESGEKLG